MPFWPSAALTLLALPVLAKAAVLELFEQLLEPVAQRLLVLLQVVWRSRPAAGPALLSLLAALAVLPALVLALAERAVAQVLLLADHVAELVELRHHVVHVVAVLVRRRHLQIFHHLLELLQKLLRRVLGAVARQVLEAIEHALQIPLA